MVLLATLSLPLQQATQVSSFKDSCTFKLSAHKSGTGTSKMLSEHPDSSHFILYLHGKISAACMSCLFLSITFDSQ